jgi:hypothetical protein
MAKGVKAPAQPVYSGCLLFVGTFQNLWPRQPIGDGTASNLDCSS